MTPSSLILRTIVLAIISLTLTGCDSSGPVLSDVSLVGNPNPTVPLAAILTLSTDEQATLTIDIDDGERQWSVRPTDAMSTDHEVPVLGMRSGRVHTITATLQDAKGNHTVSDTLTFETPPLPATFPTPRVTVHKPESMEPGVTIFNVNGRWGSDGKPGP